MSSALIDSTLSDELCEALRFELKRQFGIDYSTKQRFAIRSSAIGEDGSELSSAGQMETFLDVMGFDQVYR